MSFDIFVEHAISIYLNVLLITFASSILIYIYDVQEIKKTVTVPQLFIVGGLVSVFWFLTLPLVMYVTFVKQQWRKNNAKRKNNS